MNDPLVRWGDDRSGSIGIVLCKTTHYNDVILTTMASQITSLTVALNRLFRRRSKKTSKLRVNDFCVGNSPRPVNSPHKGPVTRNRFPFDYVIMTGKTPRLSSIGHRFEAYVSDRCLIDQSGTKWWSNDDQKWTVIRRALSPRYSQEAPHKTHRTPKIN